MATISPAEIRALVSILDELDYYEILSLARGAPGSEVRRAYHAASSRFHPDVNRDLEGPTREALHRIAKRVAEAYSVLRDPRRRVAYDRRLGSEQSARRMQLTDAQEADKQALQDRLGATPNGRRFHALATSELERGNLEAAIRNLQMAITFEPANQVFKQRLDELRRRRR